MSFFTSSSERRFIPIAVLSFVTAFALVWLWAVSMPLAFLDREYASWRVKQSLLDACDLGDILVLGDSRAAVGMIPGFFPLKTTNLAIGGGEAVEMWSIVRRLAHCARPPRQVIVSIDAGHFMHRDLFWDRSVLFGFVTTGDVAFLRALSRELDDWTIYRVNRGSDLPALARDVLYGMKLPSLYFASLVKGGLFRRWAGNLDVFAASLASRGQYYFGTAAGSTEIAVDAKLQHFQPLPVNAWYFEQTLKYFASQGIAVTFVAMPMNTATARAVAPHVAGEFRAWLGGLEAKYPNFGVMGAVMPHWPDRYFGDAFSHFNPEGAEAFSAALASCFRAEPWRQACVERAQQGAIDLSRAEPG